MRMVRMLALPLILVLIAAACTTDQGDGDGEQEENTGSVNVMNALEPEENAVLQGISDRLIQGDYEVEFEQVDDVAQQIQIRAEGGTLDVVLVPQPGAVQ